MNLRSMCCSIAALCTTTVLVACVDVRDKAVSDAFNYAGRIFERDLTIAIPAPSSLTDPGPGVNRVTDLVPDVQKITPQPTPPDLPAWHVDFANESIDFDSSTIPFNALKQFADAGMHFFIVGQSHGVSTVGTSSLAVRRANRVAAALQTAGFNADRIHTVASWSRAPEAFASNRGVDIVVLREGSSVWSSLVAMTTTKPSHEDSIHE